GIRGFHVSGVQTCALPISKLLKVDLPTGKIQQQLSLDPKYFGEGVTILRDTIYQLTWQERKVFAYTLDFRKVKEFSINTQGWGKIGRASCRERCEDCAIAV